MDHDTGLRYLGYWVDLCGDWGEQMARLEGIMGDFEAKVRPARVSLNLLLYLLR